MRRRAKRSAFPATHAPLSYFDEPYILVPDSRQRLSICVFVFQGASPALLGAQPSCRAKLQRAFPAKRSVVERNGANFSGNSQLQATFTNPTCWYKFRGKRRKKIFFRDFFRRKTLGKCIGIFRDPKGRRSRYCGFRPFWAELRFFPRKNISKMHRDFSQSKGSEIPILSILAILGRIEIEFGNSPNAFY